MKENFSVLKMYGDNLTEKTYITNPAIRRENEIKEMILILLSMDKSAIIVGEPGTGKTSLVEGLAYKIQNNDIPNVLKEFEIINVNATALVGDINVNGESKLKFQVLIDELLMKKNVILFIDEIHTLIGDESLDFANMIKPAVARGDIKVIGATTNAEYNVFIIRDKAFVRRFSTVEITEPSNEDTIEILLGTVEKIEKKTNTKLNYSDFLKRKIAEFITDLTKECNRVYGMGSKWPDIALNILNMAHASALYDNSNIVNMNYIYKAIEQTDKIYPDIKEKYLKKFTDEFLEVAEEN